MNKKRILFVGLSSNFTPGMQYQDNCLCDVFLNNGFEVFYISNPEMFIDGKIKYVGPECLKMSDGLNLIRISYSKAIPLFMNRKIRLFNGLHQLICSIKPDVIFCHNFQYLSIKDVIKYKKNNPKVKLYVDNHCAEYNSARNILSKLFLHRLLYNSLSKRISPLLENFFYVGESEKEFAKKYYSFSLEKYCFLPLGGIPLDEKSYIENRTQIRNELNVSDDEFLFVHSGKIDPNKKTDVLLTSFSKCQDLRAKLIIIGSISEDMNLLFKMIQSDKRILYLGWKDAGELQKYLCAADFYCQPGSVSATLQNAICQRCIIISYPHETYKNDLDFGQFLWVKTENDLIRVFNDIANRKVNISLMKKNSTLCCSEMLDYRTIIKKIC